MLLSRQDIQLLAKQHGVRANMKTSEIEAALKEIGVELSTTEAPKKRRGLAVRDMNEMEDAGVLAAAVAAMKKPAAAKPAPAKPATAAAAAKPAMSLFFDENAQDAENRHLAPAQPRRSQTVLLPTYTTATATTRMATRRSTERMLQEQQQQIASAATKTTARDSLASNDTTISSDSFMLDLSMEEEEETEEEKKKDDSQQQQQQARLLSRLNCLHASLLLQADLQALLALTRQLKHHNA